MSACALNQRKSKFDGGKTWPLKRGVYEGSFAYSSLSAGRPGTPSEGWIYLHFEGGPNGGSNVARFNLSWLLQGVFQWFGYGAAFLKGCPGSHAGGFAARPSQYYVDGFIRKRVTS